MRLSTRRRSAGDVARLLRLSVSDWHAWLSGRALNEDEWRETPGWARHVVLYLDLGWALSGELSWYLDRDHYDLLYQRVFSVREWVRGASDELVGMPEVERLWDEVVAFEAHLESEVE